jgi:hypothetical protein
MDLKINASGKAMTEQEISAHKAVMYKFARRRYVESEELLNRFTRYIENLNCHQAERDLLMEVCETLRSFIQRR